MVTAMLQTACIAIAAQLLDCCACKSCTSWPISHAANLMCQGEEDLQSHSIMKSNEETAAKKTYQLPEHQ